LIIGEVSFSSLATLLLIATKAAQKNTRELQLQRPMKVTENDIVYYPRGHQHQSRWETLSPTSLFRFRFEMGALSLVLLLFCATYAVLATVVYTPLLATGPHRGGFVVLHQQHVLSGGPAHLHQIAAALRHRGFDSWMASPNPKYFARGIDRFVDPEGQVGRPPLPPSPNPQLSPTAPALLHQHCLAAVTHTEREKTEKTEKTQCTHTHTHTHRNTCACTNKQLIDPVPSPKSAESTSDLLRKLPSLSPGKFNARDIIISSGTYRDGMTEELELAIRASGARAVVIALGISNAGREGVPFLHSVRKFTIASATNTQTNAHKQNIKSSSDTVMSSRITLSLPLPLTAAASAHWPSGCLTHFHWSIMSYRVLLLPLSSSPLDMSETYTNP
jgi:hypothetical protein